MPTASTVRVLWAVVALEFGVICALGAGICAYFLEGGPLTVCAWTGGTFVAMTGLSLTVLALLGSFRQTASVP